MNGPYLDTSALAKWYLNEPQSEQFEAFILLQPQASISRLTTVEFRCLLGRRRRCGDITKALEAKLYSAFEDDIRRGALAVHSLDDQHMSVALELIVRLQKQPLRTLDALHLAVVIQLRINTLATADRVMADAGKALGLDVVAFF